MKNRVECIKAFDLVLYDWTEGRSEKHDVRVWMLYVLEAISTGWYNICVVENAHINVSLS